MKSSTSSRWVLLLFLVGPTFVLFTAFVVVPVFQAAFFSLYKWNGLGPMVDFRGVTNFLNLFQNPVFLKALGNNLIVVAISLTIALPLALTSALILANAKFKGAVLFRTFFFLPYVLSEVVAGVLWQFIYHPQYGLVRAFTSWISPESGAPVLLGNPDTVLGAIMIVVVWKYFGFHMSILIAGLQDIPTDIQEAARIDGAGEGQTLWRIVLPLLKPTILISVFFSVVGSFQLFDIIWAMGKGDPVNGAETMVSFLYKFGIQRLNIGFGGAVAVTIFGICLLFSVAYTTYVSREEKK